MRLFRPVLGIAVLAVVCGVPSQGVEVQEILLQDRDRDRQLEALLFLPQGEGPFPIILFSPGFLLSGRDYQKIGTYLAEQGFAVALLSYRFSLFSPDHRALVQDLLFSIQRLLELEIRLDPQKIGLLGHSLGGKISLLAASEEPRVRAVAALDPVDAGPPGQGPSERFPLARESLDIVHIPILLIGAELGGKVRFGSPCAPEEANFQRIWERARGPAWAINQLGAGHMDYLDNPNCGLLCTFCAPGKNPDLSRSHAQRYLALFFKAFLVEAPEFLEALEHLLRAHEKEGLIVVMRKPAN